MSLKSNTSSCPQTHTFPCSLAQRTAPPSTPLVKSETSGSLSYLPTQKPIHFVHHSNLIKNVLQENYLPKSLVLCGRFNYVDEIAPEALSSGSQPFTQIVCPVFLSFPLPLTSISVAKTRMLNPYFAFCSFPFL